MALQPLFCAKQEVWGRLYSQDTDDGGFCEEKYLLPVDKVGETTPKLEGSALIAAQRIGGAGSSRCVPPVLSHSTAWEFVCSSVECQAAITCP